MEFEDLIKISREPDFSTNFTMLSLNIRSLPNKIDKLSNILAQLNSPPAVICLQELWSTHSNLMLQGYHPLEFYSRDMDSVANPNCGGGVGIFIRSNLEYNTLKIDKAVIKGVMETIWVRVKISGKSEKIIGCCYRPNSTPLASPTKFISAIDL